VATARVYEKNGNYALATEEYEKALKAAPKDVPALLSYGHLLDHQGKLPEASAMYARAVKANPKEAAAYNDLGLCYARRGMTKDSLKALSKAVELQPERALYRNNIATVLVDQRRPEEALAQLRSVQSEAVANYNVGYLLLQRKQDALAEGHFRRALQLDPSMAEARDWCERLALRSPDQPPMGPQMASVPTSMPRAGAYGPAPEPVSSVYMRPQTAPAADLSLTGSRYAAANPLSGRPVPPTPDTLSNYQPATQNAELRFLPPVQ
jgi:Tfp pilus assembly protein PilF